MMKDQPNHTERTSVLVVGAGPTGMTAAIELARRGVDCRIIERRTEPSTRSKALVVHARTLEFMDVLGIADEFVQRGYTSPGIDFSANAKNPLRANLYGLDTRFPYILILPQATTEALLEQKLQDLGVRVERGHELTDFVTTDQGVQATVAREEGESLTLDADYLLGADGPHSTVRKKLSIPFEGSSYGWTAFLGDIQLEGHHAEGGTEQHSNQRGLAFIVPFEDGSHRIVTIDRNYQDGSKKKDLSLEELQESIRAILEKPVTLHDPKWLTRWGASLKQAPQYRKGRVFLAGDAAHTHSPAGGQGMNTGIQDAFNLGWKLALVVKKQAPQRLLSSYHAERHAIGQQVLRVSNLLLRSLLLRQPLLRKLRQGLFRLVIPLPPVQKALARNLSGLGIRYKTGEGSLSGARLPDMELMNSQHEPVRLYELLRYAGYTLLVHIDPTQAQDQHDTVAALLSVANREAVRSHVILNSGLPERHAFDTEVYVDYRGDFKRKVGAATGRTLLLRPDGHVAFETSEWNVERFRHQLRSWVADPTASSQSGELVGQRAEVH